MRALRTTLALAAVLAGSLFASAAASAATTVGHSCQATGVAGDLTITQLSGSGQLTMPTDGVLTSWHVDGSAKVGGIPQWLKVLRPVGGNTFAIVDEDVGVIRGSTTIRTRIPVKAGDRLGLGAEGLLFYCNETDGEIGIANGDLEKGSSGEFQPAPDDAVPVTATLEPDADGDGWGDETQDLCPQSAEVLLACPKPGIDAFAVQTAGFAKVFAAPFGPGKFSISFKGAVKIPAAASPTGKKVTVSWKGARDGTQGQFTSVKMKFSRHLVEALKRPGVKLPLKLSVTATNVAGLKSTKRLTLKVK